MTPASPVDWPGMGNCLKQTEGETEFLYPSGWFLEKVDLITEVGGFTVCYQVG